MAAEKVQLARLGFTRGEPPPSTQFGCSGGRLGASPPADATSAAEHSRSSARYIGSCAAGKPAAGGHDVPRPRRRKVNPNLKFIREQGLLYGASYANEGRIPLGEMSCFPVASRPRERSVESN